MAKKDQSAEQLSDKEAQLVTLCQALRNAPQFKRPSLQAQLDQAVIRGVDDESSVDSKVHWLRFCQSECGHLLSLAATADMAKEFLDIFHSDHERYASALNDAENLIASRKIASPSGQVEAIFLRNASLIWDTIGHATADLRYCDKAIDANRKLLKSKAGRRLMFLDIKANLAGMLFKRQEIGGLTDASVKADLREALGYSQYVYDVGADKRLGEVRAIDCEQYALVNLALSRNEAGNAKVDRLIVALRAAEESVRVGDEGLPWSKHEEVRSHILFDLVESGELDYEKQFVDSCRELISSGYPCPGAYWNLGSWLRRTGDPGQEHAYRLLLEGAAQYPGPTARIEAYAQVISTLTEQPPPSDDDTWRVDTFVETLSRIEGEIRSLLTPFRGAEYTRNVARQLWWLGSFLADLRLRKDGDWEGALTALGCMSDAIWEMKTGEARARETSADLSGDLQLAAERQAYAALQSPRRPDAYPGLGERVHSPTPPTLIVLSAGTMSGWALIRSAESNCSVVELPGCGAQEVSAAADQFHGTTRQVQNRRGNQYVPVDAIADWLDASVVGPILASGASLTSWIVWCPMGTFAEFPLSIDRLAPGGQQSFVSDPLFIPDGLEQHRPHRGLRNVNFLGWLDYGEKAGYLHGVAGEAAEFEKHGLGEVHLDEPIEALPSETFTSDLHLACHGVETSSLGDAYLLLGQREVGIESIGAVFRGERDLVLLNACLTLNPAEGLWDQHLTVARSFGVAGSRSVIGNLWPVADGGGLPEIFVQAFYSALCANGSRCRCECCVSRALSTCQRVLEKQGVAWDVRAGWQHYMNS